MIQNLLPQKQLNKDFWPEGVDGKLNSSIRYQLLKIAKDFKSNWDLKESGITEIKIVDVHFTGSLANYNWSQYSDIDIHLKIDFSSLEKRHIETAKAYLIAQKNLYNSQHNILIKGFEVEVYPESTDSEGISTGIYSLFKNEWIKKPQHFHVNPNKEYIIHKTKQIIGLINLIKNQEGKFAIKEIIKLLDHLQKKIKKIRQTSLSKEGEYAENNLVFKILRRLGYLEEIWNLKIKLTDKSLSVN